MDSNLTLSLAVTTFFAFFTVYTLGSFAGLISERSGIVNIALDGKMIMGALMFALLMSNESFVNSLGRSAPYMAIMIAGAITAIYSLIFIIPTVFWMSEQVITGTAINLISVAFSLLMLNTLRMSDSITIASTSAGWAGEIDTTAIVMAIVSLIIIIIGWLVISKTHYGLRLKTSGENPYSLETSGISVYKTRVIALLFAGFLSGVAGSLFPITSSGTFTGTVNGSGYISIAILIIGQWSVVFVFLAAIGFAILTSISTIWITLQNLNDAIPYELFNIIPFIIPLVVLPFIKNSSSPAFAGKPYKKDLR